MAEDVEEAAREVADLLVGRRTVVLTGAGMSTDSGIPDYRGDGGDRRRAPGITYLDFMRDAEARRRYWARSQAGYRHLRDATPNVAHAAVTVMQQAGLLAGVITQNVDGLHTRAGTAEVLELHGRVDRTICTSCGDRRDRDEVHGRLSDANPSFEALLDVVSTPFAPDGDADLAESLLAGFRVVDCVVCGGMLKPDVVFFGESMPRDRRDLAEAVLADADALLVLGSSLAVMSGYRLVLQAARAEQPIGILTRGPSRGDHLADVRVDAGLADVLPAVLEVLGIDDLDGGRPQRDGSAGRSRTP